jgi:hypothetical protein
MTTETRNLLGGGALLMGVVIFIGSRFRDHIDPTDRFLTVFLLVAFAGWFVGLLALRARYRPRVRGVGASGLMLMLVGIGLLSLGHVTMFVLDLGGPWFLPILAGTLALAVGVLLFGVDALGGRVLPRWRALPLVIGLVGLAWILFAMDSRPVEGNPEAFLIMRTAFGVAWLPLAVILMADRDGDTDGTPPVRSPVAHGTEAS